MADSPVLVITGASSGIGAATARRAVEAGYRVVLGARREDLLQSLAEELGGAEHALAVRCDVTEWDQVQALIATATDSFGRLDAAFANAGFGATRGYLEESPEHWRSMILTNVYGVALTIRAALPPMLEADAGHFVITGSVAGRRVMPGSLYSATKFAVGAIAEGLRAELRQIQENNSIRVTLLAPGMTDTDFFDNRPGDYALADDDIARTALYALQEPEGVDINEILIRPSTQGV